MLRDVHLSVADLTPRPPRTGTSALERAAVARVRACVAAMPASLVVQLALWPDELARWARAERAAESLVYNMLAGRKPYVRVRERLAARLGVPTGILARLIEAAPAMLDAAGTAAIVPPGDHAAAGWRLRRGTNALEQAAERVVAREIAAMPAATVVGLLLWPDTLSAWARGEGFTSSAVWAALAGAPSEVVTARLARRLGVSWREMLALIEHERLPVRGGPADWSPGGDGPTLVGRGAPTALADPPADSPPAPARPSDIVPAAPDARVGQAVSTDRRRGARRSPASDGSQLGFELG